MIEAITINSLSGRGTVEMATKEYRGYWLEQVDWGQVSGTHNTYAYANQIGENIISTTVNSRPISIKGVVIENQDTLQDRCDFLNAFFSPVEDYELIYQDKKIVFRPDGSIKYGRERKENNMILRKFLLQGTAPYPLFTGVTNSVASFADISKLFHFPSDFGLETPAVFGLTEKTNAAIVTNDGSFATGIIATITFTDSVTNPKIMNNTTGAFIGINYTFSEGERLELSTVSGRKYMRKISSDETITNLIKFRDVNMSWWQLAPGENEIVLSCQNQSELDFMNVVLEYMPLFMEVE